MSVSVSGVTGHLVQEVSVIFSSTSDSLPDRCAMRIQYRLLSASPREGRVVIPPADEEEERHTTDPVLETTVFSQTPKDVHELVTRFTVADADCEAFLLSCLWERLMGVVRSSTSEDSTELFTDSGFQMKPRTFVHSLLSPISSNVHPVQSLAGLRLGKGEFLSFAVSHSLGATSLFGMSIDLWLHRR